MANGRIALSPLCGVCGQRQRYCSPTSYTIPQKSGDSLLRQPLVEGRGQRPNKKLKSRKAAAALCLAQSFNIERHDIMILL